MFVPGLYLVINIAVVIVLQQPTEL